ncbi:enhanced intracellular survival protein Eis [Alkalihalobacillus sp. TS-13]|uniref:GNAT family N-acetyltransferase n=1 Tax=Alkalihalobacillus sp. TS-13 TaxID=2842455 RepID=UPI001C888824|nr:GNAT family N-acetyltransferase [Alkalihalobacillus sp. TS-13]
MEIKKIPVEDIAQFISIVSRAYPGMKLVTEDDLEKTTDRFIDIQENDDSASLYGAYQSGKLVGGMQFHDFEMMFHEQKIPVGGIGMVAVDLLHKKEGVAKALLEHFHQHYHDRGTYCTALYPFRPDFYKQMGYGYGAKMNRYRIQPAHLPKGTSKAHIVYLTFDDTERIVNFYNKMAIRTHGLMTRTVKGFSRPMKQPGNHTIGYVKDDEVKGYAGFSFKSNPEDTFLQNDIIVHEMLYENQEVLSEMLTFFHSQQDQIRSIYFDTQDEHFHHVVTDPSNGTGHLIPHIYHESNTQGVGLMYRILDTEAFLKQVSNHNFNNVTVSLNVTIQDSFVPGNARPVHFHAQNGSLTITDEKKADVEIKLDISDFSSVVMGVVPFEALYTYGKASISNTAYLHTVTDLFNARKKPICLNRF